MLRSIAYRAKNTHPVTMPLTSLLTSLQDASTKVLFGSDSGTGKSQKHHHWGGKRGVVRSDHPRVMRRNSETVETLLNLIASSSLPLHYYLSNNDAR